MEAEASTDAGSPPAEESSDMTLSAFGSALGLNLGLLVGLLIAFVVVARKFAYVYTPRSVCPQPDDTRRRPPDLNIFSITGIWQMMRLDQDELVETIGIDAAVFLRFLMLGVKYFSILSVVCCCILLPVNVHAPKVDGPTGTLSSLTVKDIANESSLLWFHVVTVVAATVFLLFLLKKEYFVYVDLRHRYHLSNHNSSLRVDQLSVLLQDIPDDIRTDEDLREYVKSFFDDDPVANSHLVNHYEKLKDRYNERVQLVSALEAALAERHNNGANDNSSEIDKMKEQLDDLNGAISELQQENGDPTRAGFVTFTTFQGAAMASQIPMTTAPEMFARPAPEPHDIDWDSVVMSRSERSLRRVLVLCSFALLLFAFEMPVALISMMANLENLTLIFTGLTPLLNDNPMVKGLLEGFLPSIGMIIMLAIVPPLLRMLSSMKGLATQPQVQRSTFTFFYYFQMIHIVFSTTLVPAFLGADLSAVSVDWFFQVLADSLPKANGFYINMILAKAFFALPLELLMPAPLLMTWFFMRRASSATSVRESANPGPFYFDENYPTYLLMFGLGLIYLPIAPIIIPFCAILCLLASIIYRYQILYIWSRRSETGGVMFPLAFARIIFSLVFAQLAMVGILLNKSCNIMAVIVALLVPATINFYIRMRKECGERAKKLVLKDLAQLDEALRTRSRRVSLDKNTSFSNLRKNGNSAYRQPWVLATPISYKVMEEMASDAVPLLQKVPGDHDALRRLVSTEFLLEARMKSRNVSYEV